MMRLSNLKGLWYPVIVCLAIAAMLVTASCSAPAPSPHPSPAPRPAPAPTPAPSPGVTPSPLPWMPGQPTIGLAAGGAKDVNNFRYNIKNDYLPLPTDITCEGLFYDYYFDTGPSRPSNKLFSPSYATAVTRDPLSGKVERYLSVGLNSGMKESEFQRKRLNLVIVLDVSGSMDEYLNNYYYDSTRAPVRKSTGEGYTKKIDAAKQSVAALLGHLDEGDRFGIVLFDSMARVLTPIRVASGRELDYARQQVQSVYAGGSTNMADGMRVASDMLWQYGSASPAEFENRIIFLTDAMPNTGDISDTGLFGTVRRNAGRHIYTTFVGIGVDFNSQLVQSITRTRGANYYSVHTPWELQERLDTEFDQMVTPLVFNLRLSIENQGWRIERVYGSPGAGESGGDLMRVDTLFPSSRSGNETRGGIILLKMVRTAETGGRIRLLASYEDRQGRQDWADAVVSFPDERPEYFDHTGIRKGILLARYADLIQDWVWDEREHASYSRPWEPRVNREDGIVRPPAALSRWERQSMPLTVSSGYRGLFADFSDYFQREMRATGDTGLQQEADILNKLAGQGGWWRRG